MIHLSGNHYMQKLVDDGLPKTSESLATLALAYEQRTANLIALAQLAVSIDGPSVDLRNDFADIAERIGQRVGATETDRVALEQEALKLRKVWKLGDGTRAETFDELTNVAKEKWLAVARAAREINAPTGDQRG